MNLSSRIFFILSIVFLLCIACKSDSNTPDESVRSNDLTTIKLSGQSGITEDVVKRILDECIQIDVNFYNETFSMNQSEKAAIYNDLSFISPDPITEIPEQCRPIARKVYASAQDIILESDVYFSENCLFFVFIKDEQRLYGNMMNQKGVEFYNQLFAKVQSMN